MAPFVTRHRFFENLFGLRISPVSDVDLSFSDRVHFIGINCAGPSLIEIRQERAVTGIHQTTGFRPGHAIRLEIRWHQR